MTCILAMHYRRAGLHGKWPAIERSLDLDLIVRSI